MRVMLVAAESLNYSHILNFLSLFVGVGEKGINIKKKKNKTKHKKRHLGNPNLFLVFSVKTEHRQLNAV